FSASRFAPVNRRDVRPTTLRFSTIRHIGSPCDMIRRLIVGFAVSICVLVVLGVSLWAYLLRVPKHAMPHLAGELRSSSLAVDGRQRTFTFYVPPRLRANPPLLLVLHGSMMNGKRMRADTAYAF